ncbi:MAG: hypothetical protein MJ154_03445 [Candidatus Saccharibacteria bacterium]|nr:hypothetical protein [Candidatus Saccharibacteria bacterium]
MSKKKALIIGSASVAVAAIAGTAVLFAINSTPSTFRLDDEYYAQSESMDIKKDEYENLISQNKTFVVMIDKPGCVTTKAMRENMVNFPEDTQFKYYRMMWEEVKESSLHEYVKYTPSVAIIYQGKVKAYLQADSDEDAVYFNDGEALKNWIRKYIIF